ncbi:methyltransferase domain-containing protein [Nocardioides humilatus]|uniref:methyltransferase domain-containing protein n=1 Tax=Nocardioides humilatus TaxID=2607660 RepID=UPI00165F2AD4|nr:methyltransferase domain-containing protein [Nocardioides humilatus]
MSGYLPLVETTDALEPECETEPGATTEVALFGGIEVTWDPRVLRPRPWTTAQSHWVAALSPACPDGPILELCCGAGQIGVLAASLTGRTLVQVDRHPVAATYARRNAGAAGVLADVREAWMQEALMEDEQFALVILDPPWVHSARVDDFPDDPADAIDGGVNGTAQLVLGLGIALRHLLPGGHVIAQVGDHEQVDVLRAVIEGQAGAHVRWAIHEVRDYLPGGLLVDVGPRRVNEPPMAPSTTTR